MADDWSPEFGVAVVAAAPEPRAQSPEPRAPVPPAPAPAPAPRPTSHQLQLQLPAQYSSVLAAGSSAPSSGFSSSQALIRHLQGQPIAHGLWDIWALGFGPWAIDGPSMRPPEAGGKLPGNRNRNRRRPQHRTYVRRTCGAAAARPAAAATSYCHCHCAGRSPRMSAAAVAAAASGQRHSTASGPSCEWRCSGRALVLDPNRSSQKQKPTACLAKTSCAQHEQGGGCRCVFVAGQQPAGPGGLCGCEELTPARCL
jgi:hypothetical protein